MEPRIVWRVIAHYCKHAFQDLCDDLRTARWARGFCWFSFLVIWCGGMLIAITAMALSGSTTSFNTQFSACLPDGSFTLQPDLYSPFQASRAFDITLAFGSLSFANAKLIDVIWDIVMGRGIQILLSLISCFVFARYITATMAVSPVSYATYSTTFLRFGPNIASILTLLREFIFYRALDSKVAMIWMTVSATFVAAFPTWVSAMSGYSGERNAFVKDVSGNLVLLSDFNYIEYVVHDGGRIGLNNDYYVTGDFVAGYPYLGSDCDSYTVPVVGYPSGMPTGRYLLEPFAPTTCFIRSNISSYVATYGFYGKNNTNSTFANYTLPAPSLNISAYYIASPQIYGGSWKDPSTGNMPFANYSDAAFESGNITYSLDYLLHNGTCQPLGTYQWGFSFLLLFIFLLTLLIWSIGMCVLWIVADHSLRVREIHEIPGEYKAILELASTMQGEFDKKGVDPTLLNEHQITRKIRRDLNGGRITRAGLETEQSTRRFHEIFTRWFKKERWWLLLFAIFTGIWSGALPTTISAPSQSPLFFLVLGLTTSFGVLLAMLVGRKTGSRVLIVLFFVVVGLTIIFPAVSPEAANSAS